MFTNARRQPSISSSSSAHSYHVNENDTHDSFSRKMMQEMRTDRESRAEAAAAWRANNTNTTRPIAFSRARQARIRPRVELTVENVERVTISDSIGNDQIRDRSVEKFEREASVNSSGGASRNSEPSLNVPRTWARKAKRDNAWLKRLAADLNQSGDLPVQKSDSIDWSAAAGDLALPTTEDSPTSRRSSRRGTPASVAAPRPRIVSYDQVDRDREQESSVEFTLGDAITSTPALASRNTKLEEIRRREIEQAGWEVVQESILPTPPPEDQGIDHATRKPANESKPAAKSQEDLQNAFSHPAEQDISTSRPTIKPLNKPGSFRKRPLFSGPMSPVRTLTKSASTVGVVDKDVLPEIQKSPERPVHRRQDSRDLLRQWSRAASGTPSPGRVVTSATNPAEHPGLANEEQTGEAAAQPEIPKSEANLPTRQQEVKSTNSYAPSITSRLSNKEDRRPASTRSTESKETSDKPTHPPPLQQTKSLPIKLSIPNDPKTPVVTGAWIDTPAPVLAKVPDLPRPRSAASMRDGSLATAVNKQSDAPIFRQRPSSVPAVSNSARSGEPVERRIPSLPTSALANLVDRTRENGDAEFSPDGLNDLGDATMMSLREIIQAPIGDDNTIVELPPRSANTSPTRPRPSAAEKLRAQEMRTLNQMNRRLLEARKNLRDAGDGIERVERLVKGTTVEPRPAVADPVRGSGSKPAPKTDANSEPRFSTHPFTTLWAGGRRMILEDDINTRGRNSRSKRRSFDPFSRLTWFGLVLASIMLWGLLEGAACAAFCRPIYSPPTKQNPSTTSPNTLSNPYNLHPNAPTFPTVLPTLALQTIQSIPLMGHVTTQIAAAMASLFGASRFASTGFPTFELRRGGGGGGAESIVPTVTKSFARTPTSTAVEDSYYAAAAAATTANGFDDLGDWGMEGDEFL